MGADDVFPAEMPDHPSHPLGPPTMVPLDDDTAERLLAGRLHPEDAPPGYAEVARLLRAAAGPPSQDELAGQEAAMAGFRAARRGPGERRARRHQAPFRLRRRLAGVGARRSRARVRLVALALAGTLVAGGVWMGGGTWTAGGVWTADGALTALGLRSPSGGPGAGGSGSSRPVTTPVTGGRAPALPSASDRATARHGRGATARGGGPANGSRPAAHGRPPTAKPPKAGKDKPGKDRSGETKPPKANPAPVGNRGHGHN
jgi:hypothetical protein